MRGGKNQMGVLKIINNNNKNKFFSHKKTLKSFVKRQVVMGLSVI
jgi:hypothetical protein